MLYFRYHLLGRCPKLAKLAQGLPYLISHLVVCGRCRYVGQILLQRTHIRVYTHAVVVQYYQQVGWVGTRMVHSFKSHAPRHCSISYHRHHLSVGLPFHPTRHGHSQACRDRGSTVPYPKRVILTFLALWEARYAPVDSIGVEGIHPPRQYLVAIGLVPHIPYQLVIRRVVRIVQSHRKLHHP